MTYHPAPDLDAPPPADDRLHARGFIQCGQASWVRIESIEWVQFNTGPGDDFCTLRLRNGETEMLDGQEARDFWVAWTRYLAGDE